MVKIVAYFTSDVTDSNTISRAEAFLAAGHPPVVIGFRRGRYNGDFHPPWHCIPLGHTRDGCYLLRLFAVLRALPILMANRRTLAKADVFYARNIDQLALALFVRAVAGRKLAIAYEILDIQPPFVGRSMLARLCRAIERYGLKRIQLLVLSSPGFLHHYFAPLQRYDAPWYLLENKLPPSFAAQPANIRPALSARRSHAPDSRWVVGYCGLIRGEATFNLIVRLAERLKDRVLFRFRGVFTTVRPQTFTRALARLDNLVYDGPYKYPEDLAGIYGGLDFAWALDLENVDHNSRWLRPCRFYEAGYFGVPCLAASGFEIGTLVEDLQAGWSFAAPYEDALVAFFQTLTEEDYAARRNQLLMLPPARFMFDNDAAVMLQALTTPPAVPTPKPEPLAAD